MPEAREPGRQAARVLLVVALSLPLVAFLAEGVARPIAGGFRGFVDFAPYYRGSVALLRGEDPYDLAATERIGREEGATEGTGHRYLYPPIFGYLSAPLALLPYPTAKATWFASSLLALAGSVLLLPGLARSSVTPSDRLLVLLLAASALPTTQTLRLGQVNLHLLFLVLLSLEAARRNRPILSGAAVGLAAAVKVTPGLLLGVFLVRREWRALLCGVLVAAGLTALGFSLAPDEAWPSFCAHVLPWYGKGHAAVDNQSIHGFLLRVLTGDASPASPDADLPAVRQAGWIARLASLAVLGITAVVLARSRRVPRLLAFATVLAAASLASAITWVHHLVALLPGFAVLLLGEGPADGAPRARSGLSLAAFLLVALPLGYDDGNLRGPLLPFVSTKLAGTLLVWALLLRETFAASATIPSADRTTIPASSSRGPRPPRRP